MRFIFLPVLACFLAGCITLSTNDESKEPVAEPKSTVKPIGMLHWNMNCPIYKPQKSECRCSCGKTP